MTQRDRINLSLRAVVVPFRDRAVQENADIRHAYCLRASALLGGLEDAVRGIPDLRLSLAAARAELGLG